MFVGCLTPQEHASVNQDVKCVKDKTNTNGNNSWIIMHRNLYSVWPRCLHELNWKEVIYLGLWKEGRMLYFHAFSVDLWRLGVKLPSDLILTRTRNILHKNWDKNDYSNLIAAERMGQRPSDYCCHSDSKAQKWFLYMCYTKESKGHFTKILLNEVYPSILLCNIYIYNDLKKYCFAFLVWENCFKITKHTDKTA